MLAPTLVFDGGGLALALGAAGGTRLRSALVQAGARIVDLGWEPQDAVDAPRLHVDGRVVHAEPGVEERGLQLLAAEGYEVRRWDALHHFFGGVSCVGRGGPAGDPRRDGLGLVVGSEPAGV